MALKRFLLACALTASLAAPCHAEVLETTKYNYYAVTVGSQRLGDALVAAYPLEKTGVHGHTQWHFDWHFDTARTAAGTCRVTSVTTKLQIMMILPRIASASAEDLARFNAYLPKLRAHEDGHVAIARQAANDIDRAIGAITNAPCATIVADTNQIAYSIVNATDAAEIKYDDDTQHGKTQGAWLE